MTDFVRLDAVVFADRWGALPATIPDERWRALHALAIASGDPQVGGVGVDVAALVDGVRVITGRGVVADVGRVVFAALVAEAGRGRWGQSPAARLFADVAGAIDVDSGSEAQVDDWLTLVSAVRPKSIDRVGPTEVPRWLRLADETREKGLLDVDAVRAFAASAAANDTFAFLAGLTREAGLELEAEAVGSLGPFFAAAADAGDLVLGWE